jgi:ABC-2 type transport system permease protein/lipopolysaccharide transport system permease protein
MTVDDAMTDLILRDPASIPSGPAPETFYRHRVHLVKSIRIAWGRRGVAFALAERDVRTSYKQAALGMLWALISPVLTVIIFTLIFSHVKSLKVPGVPYILYSYVGLVCWGYFAGAVGSGGSAVLSNLNLLQKTHFPRELFPLSQALEQMLYTTIGLIPLSIIFALHRFSPKIEGLWVPLFIIIEIVFATGLMLAMAAAVVYLRDLLQVMGIILTLGLFATPIIWPLSKLQNISYGPLHHWDLRPYYAVLNPIGPVIDNVRRTLLLDQAPDWPIVGLAALSAFAYLFLGYRLFKRLETGFADIS